eukprot:4160152-Pleurochrysis_carterae.AAC.1
MAEPLEQLRARRKERDLDHHRNGDREATKRRAALERAAHVDEEEPLDKRHAHADERQLKQEEEHARP